MRTPRSWRRQGAEGGYQIQVASFKDANDADAFAADLRKRGHHAYRQAAYVAGRGAMAPGAHRAVQDQVRSHQVQREVRKKTERVSGFVVDPDKVKLADEIRAAKMAVRERRKNASRVMSGSEE